MIYKRREMQESEVQIFDHKEEILNVKYNLVVPIFVQQLSQRGSLEIYLRNLKDKKYQQKITQTQILNSPAKQIRSPINLQDIAEFFRGAKNLRKLAILKSIINV